VADARAVHFDLAEPVTAAPSRSSAVATESCLRPESRASIRAAPPRCAHAAGLRRASISGKNRVVPVRLLEDLLVQLGLRVDGEVALRGEPVLPELASPLAVAECAIASVAASLLAAAELAELRTGRRPEVALDTAHVAAAVRSESLLRDPAGSSARGFAPLSRLWRTADGWVRTHANYPWHRAALLNAFGLPERPDAEIAPSLAAALAAQSSQQIEAQAYAAGGLAVAARTASEWYARAPGRAATTGPLVVTEPLGDAAPLPPSGPLPASRLRVLDLTRVIAGPVGTRMLAAFGAEVLRIDDPHHPELPRSAIDGVIGKISATLDLATRSGGETLHALLSDADVLVTSYRPGALRRFGLDPDQVAERHPGTIVVSLSAWGSTGPWSSRRGFDSLVQMATGIGWATSPDGTRPGVLPCQLLDHATGYLITAATMAALAYRGRTGQARSARLSLTRTAHWLQQQGTRADPPTAQDPYPDDAYRRPLGDGWTGIAPPGQLDGIPLSWPHLPPRYGQAPAAWRE
jgi:crotonobetainyl-CoA:carnitine CoA-transferase CaiB-like acyl-CoA transferase